MVVFMVIMSVIRVANVIIVGVLYLSVYLLVGNDICSSIGNGIFLILVMMVA